MCKNKAKLARCEAGRLKIKLNNELATLDRLQASRSDALEQLGLNTSAFKASHKGQLDAKDYKREL